MAGKPNDASGTVWVHDPPDPDPAGATDPGAGGAPGAPSAPPPAADPAMAQAAGQPMGPTPAPYTVQPEPSSGGMSTGCLIALFVMGGIGLGIAVLLLLGIAGAVVYSMGAVPM